MCGAAIRRGRLTALVTLEDIAADGLGRAELRGTTWTVRNVGTTPLRRGERSRVTHIVGLTLWVHAI
jgi:inner membrane protein